MKHDVQALAKSLTGFDEIAIEKYFLKGFANLDGTLVVRALLFVAKRRDGMGDGDAFKAAMNLPVGELEDHFETPQDAVMEGDEESGEA